MSLNIRISCDSKDVERRLAGMSARSKAFQPVFEWARLELGKANAANFSTGGLPVGGWQPRKSAEPWPLMVRTGGLMRSLTALFGPPNNVSGTEATFGTKVEYAKFHQYGTSKMPARKIVFEPVGFANDLAQKAARYVARGTF